ncbi:MAG: hypothetical protein ACKO6N_16270 [Myxococcota bacterium]
MRMWLHQHAIESRLYRLLFSLLFLLPVSYCQADEALPYAWTPDQFLPFPSDVYTVEDPSTLTGKRVVLPAELLTEPFYQSLPFDGRQVVERMREQDGFAPGIPLLLALPTRLDPSTLSDLAPQPGALIQLLHARTGRRVPIRAKVFDRHDTVPASSVLVIQPMERLEDEQTYLAVLPEPMVDVKGQPIAPPPLFHQALVDPLVRLPQAARYRPYMLNLGRLLRQHGFSVERVSMAFSFTIQSAQTFYKPLQELDHFIEQKAKTFPYRLTTLTLQRKLFKGSKRAVYRGRGSFELLTFIDLDGRVREEPSLLEVELLAQLPERCPAGGCPMAIFGHGLGATKETMFQIADAFAAQGIATVGVAAPWHEFMSAPTVKLLGVKHNINLLHGLFLEHILRNVQLVELIKQDLSQRDMLPGKQAHEKTAMPLKLRADRIFYIGQSMGGICGVGVTALAPDIRAAVFDVAGGSLVDMIFESWVVKALGMPMLTLGTLKGWENHLAMALGMYLFNDIDPIGFAPHLTYDPLPGESGRLLSQQAGVGDGLVPNWTTDKLARALGLRTVRPRHYAHLKADEPDGPGLRYYYHQRHWFLAHLELMNPRSSHAAARFFRWSMERLDHPELYLPSGSPRMVRVPLPLP